MLSITTMICAIPLTSFELTQHLDSMGGSKLGSVASHIAWPLLAATISFSPIGMTPEQHEVFPALRRILGYKPIHSSKPVQ